MAATLYSYQVQAMRGGQTSSLSTSFVLCTGTTFYPNLVADTTANALRSACRFFIFSRFSKLASNVIIAFDITCQPMCIAWRNLKFLKVSEICWKIFCSSRFGWHLDLDLWSCEHPDDAIGVGPSSWNQRLVLWRHYYRKPYRQCQHKQQFLWVRKLLIMSSSSMLRHVHCVNDFRINVNYPGEEYKLNVSVSSTIDCPKTSGGTLQSSTNNPFVQISCYTCKC